MYEHLKDKTVLVTGGTGTFGRAFVTKLLKDTEVKKIIVFSRDEFKQSEMQRDFANDDKLRFFLGDIRDLQRLSRAFEGVDIVVHAAALKQVPAIEYNPMEAIKTNVIGTQNVIDASLDNNVDKVFLVSSDKAVQPINLYGSTKLCAEKLFVAANAYKGTKRQTKFSVIRYGNVLGSRGSLVEVIKRQKETGTITLTDERMTRFWISVDQVMNMVMRSLELMTGGEVFVPKMKSILVSDVIKALAPECKVLNIGIRPGEKLHETLITEHEESRTKDAGDLFVIRPESGWEDERWLKDKPTLESGYNYISSNKNFMITKEEAGKVLS